MIFDCVGEKLVGILHPGDDTVPTGVVIVVGGPQYRVGSHRQFVQMARRFAALGYPVLRFDYRGMGDSDGAPRSFERVEEDIRCAIDLFMSRTPKLRTVVLLGLCDAASASLMYGSSDPRVGGLVLLNPWARTARGEAQSYLRHYYVQRLLQKSFWRKVFSGEYELRRSLKDFAKKLRLSRQGTGTSDGSTAQPDFIERMRAGLERFRGPVLFLISGRDLTAQEFIGLATTSRAWKLHMRSPRVTVKTLSEADHTLSVSADLRRACDEAVGLLRALGDSRARRR